MTTGLFFFYSKPFPESKNSWLHPDVSPPYQHPLYANTKNINFHIVTHRQLTPRLKRAIRQGDKQMTLRDEIGHLYFQSNSS